MKNIQLLVANVDKRLSEYLAVAVNGGARGRIEQSCYSLEVRWVNRILLVFETCQD